MKHCIKLVSILATLGLPIAAEATCDRYSNATLTLNLPTTISVPNSLPVGSIITQQAFSGTSPAFIANCWGYTPRTITGRYPKKHYAGTLIYPTEVPGIGITVAMNWADGGPAKFGLFSHKENMPRGPIPTFTSAQATFYKIGPVNDGTVLAGELWRDNWGSPSDNFRLVFGNSIRFVQPPATCELAAGDASRTITLPTIQASALKDVVYAGAQDFELTAQCSDAANVTFRFTGTPAPGNPLLFDNTGTAGGVDLWLYSRLNGVPQTISANDERTVAVSGDRAVLPLSAAYHKNGTVSQGSLASTATVNITYN
ncbi:fimbrial protein [Pseudomonas reactans]|jgi:type 1 fimbria pilin|uniref:Fimbrial protein n=2 Tax=Pseudomonas reactans TaxID=117680 RepID=A0A7Y8G6D9_9PSED|nr:fimbrial protein [Pseudomonas reactans]NWE91878.1 fimbrial protein [Pseudomonas reactans]